MKKVIYGVSFLTLIGISISSCQKAEVLKEKDNSLNNNKTIHQNEISNEPIFEYYLNKEQVSKSKINFDDEDLFISITKDVKNNDEIVVVDAFTNREDYILYGEKHHLKLKELLLFEDEMKNFVEKTDVISLYNETGNVPQWYVDFEAKTYQKHFGVSSQQKSALTILHKDYSGGTNRAVGLTSPYLWGGWDNKVSAFTPIGLYGFTSLYDKSFYRKRMATIWGWGMQRVVLYWGYLYNANDRTSSVITG